MHDMLDLKNLEAKAFRAIHQDGLWDIYIGGIVLSMALLSFSDESEAFPIGRFFLFLFGLGISYLIFWAGKKYITTPRLGQVKFSPKRQKRKHTLALVLSGIVLVQAIIVIGTVLLWQNPGWAANLGIDQADPNLERLIVAVIGALFVGPSVVIMSYFNDFLRGYYIAFILSLGVFSLIWFNKPIYLIAAGMLIVIPGLFLFIHFLRSHPLPPAEVPHG